MPGAAHGRRSLARLQAVRHPSVVKGDAEAPSANAWLHRRVRVCQCAAGDGWQCDSASVGAGMALVVSLVLLIAIGGVGVG